MNVGESDDEDVLMLLPDAPLEVDCVETLVPKGFISEPPVAETRFSFAVPIISCIIMFADLLFDERGGPVRCAQIQVDWGSVKDIEPPFQVLQFVPGEKTLVSIPENMLICSRYVWEEKVKGVSHFTFAVIIPFAIPDPLKRVTSALISSMGSTSPVPNRGDNVTLFPVESAYITKIFEPAISVP